MLYQNPFPSPWQGHIYAAAGYLRQLWLWPLNQLLALFVSLPSVKQKNDAFDMCFYYAEILLFTPCYFLMLVFFWPAALLGLFLEWLLSSCRLPYKYSFQENNFRVNVNTSLWTDLSTKIFFRVAIINANLFPEAISRKHNLRNVQSRARKMGERIIHSQIHPNPQIFVRSPSEVDISTPSMYRTTNCSVFLPPQNVTHLAYYDDDDETKSFSISDGENSDEGEGVKCNEYTFQQIKRPAPDENKKETKDVRPSTSSGKKSKGRSLSISQDGLIPDVVQGSQSTSPSTPESDGSYPNTVLDRQRICTSASSTLSSHFTTQSTNLKKATSTMESQSSIKERIYSPQDHGIAATFPPGLDFICFTEVFEQRAAKSLVSLLHNCYSYILYEIGCNSWDTNRLSMDSGLIFASRYPIVDVDFQYYQVEHKYDHYKSIGLLIVKVLVGKTDEGNPVVGYCAVTELDVKQDIDYRSLQMDSVLKWLCRFHVNSQKPHGLTELVAFDVLCGTFNFDNMSPGDMCNWSHPLFLIYHDPCRLKPGVDKPWTVGTVLKQDAVDKEEVSTPDELKSILEQNHRKFLEDIETLHPDLSHMANVNNRCRGKRRTDYILFSNHLTHMIQECEEYAFVSQLASTTRHIPVCITLSAALGPTCPRGLPLSKLGTDETDNPKQCKLMFETTV